MCEYKDAAKGVFYGSSRNKLSGLENQSDEQSGETNSSSNTSEQQVNNKKLCFFKFYNFQGRTDPADKLKERFFDKYVKALSMYGGGKIDGFLNDIKNNKSSVINRFIYSHRHMGLSAFFQAICSKAEGYECVVVPFDKEEINDKKNQEFVSLIRESIEAWRHEINFVQIKDKQCPCPAIEMVVIQEISNAIRGRIKKMNSQSKRLLLLDGFDKYLCDMASKDKDIENSEDEYHYYWFYRKCWLKAIVQINQDKNLNAVIIAGILTRLDEYLSSEVLQNIKTHKGDQAYSIEELGVRYDDIFNLHSAYYTILDNIGDALFFQCPRDGSSKDCFQCHNIKNENTCKYAIGDDYYEEQPIDLGNLSEEERSKIQNMKKQIQTDILGNRIYNCNNNPWYLIIPLTHVLEFYEGDPCDGIDIRIKRYYQGTRRTCGDLQAEFYKVFPLYCNPQYNYKRLCVAKREFQQRIQQEVKNGSDNIELKRTGRTEKCTENIMIKVMLQDSGLTCKKSKKTEQGNGNKNNDKVKIHPFVVSVYSSEPIFESN